MNCSYSECNRRLNSQNKKGVCQSHQFVCKCGNWKHSTSNRCKDCYKNDSRWLLKQDNSSKPKNIWDVRDVYWIAGIVEGEGSIFTSQNKNDRFRYGQVKVSMTDEDIIKRLHSITNIGTVSYSDHASKKNSNHKPIWNWKVSRANELYRLLLSIYPILGIRRRSQIKIIMETCI